MYPYGWIILILVVTAGISLDKYQDSVKETVVYNITVIEKDLNGMLDTNKYIETNHGMMTTRYMSIYSELEIGKSYVVSTKMGDHCPDIRKIEG